MDKYYFIKRLNEKIILTYKPKSIHKVLYVFSTIFWVPLPLLLVGVLLPLFKLTSWNILFLFGGLSIFSYLIAFIIGLSNKDLEYIFTNKGIYKLTGSSYYKVEYEEIKNIKKKYSLFSKKIGTVKIYKREGSSFNYHLNGIDNIDIMYNKISTIIIDNSNSLYNL